MHRLWALGSQASMKTPENDHMKSVGLAGAGYIGGRQGVSSFVRNISSWGL